MPRGRPWAVYIDDLNREWALRVDADSIDDIVRGWTVVGVETLFPLPREWTPRKVVGTEESGVIHPVVVASLTCDLWTGAATTFEVECSDGLFRTCKVIGRRNETRRGPPP